MSIKMTDDLPQPRIGSRHMRIEHLTRIDGHTRHRDTVMHNVVTVPVHNMRVKAHIHQVKDGCIIDAYAEWRIVGEDEAVDLLPVSLCLALKKELHRR